MALFKTIEFVIEMMTSSGLDNAWNVTLITLGLQDFEAVWD